MRAKPTYFILASLLFLISLSGLFWFSKAQEKLYLSPSEVKEGWRVFFQKGCIDCHSIWGKGGKIGSDLSQETPFTPSAAQLAGIMWNHAPEMWNRMGEERITSFQIGEEEMVNLFSLLYFVRYMDQPGNPWNGERLLSQKRCNNCHSIQGKGGKIGKDLSNWGSFTNPILWAQMMWNHGPQMEKLMSEKNLPWPQFEKDEMNDLISYIRSVSQASEKVYLSLGDPESGEALFRQKGCIKCHNIGGGKGIDLTKTQPFPTTLGQMAGLMWNHLPKMWKLMENKEISLSKLSAQEMADLISYIFSSRYFKHKGKAEVGKRIFSEKKCDLCHAEKAILGATDLSEVKEEITPVFLAYAMWNHGQTMLKEMRERGVRWPKFRDDEIEHLLKYLNSLGK